MMKILVYLKGFTGEERKALAQVTALWLASGQLPSTILPILINVSLVERSTYWFIKPPSTLPSSNAGAPG